MAQLTIDVPDTLAVRLQPVQDHIVDILEYGLRFFETFESRHDIIIEFLLNHVGSQEIMTFPAPEAVNVRIAALLFKNQAGIITPSEETELDQYVSLNHLMIQLKARASGQQ